MQTFLPYPDIHESVRVLDNVRLSNQRNEGLVIARTLLGLYGRTKSGRPGGWPFHPATKMWKGYEISLLRYCIAASKECIERGIRDSVLGIFKELKASETEAGGTLRNPPWLGDPRLHRSHRSNLVRKDPEWYGKLFDEPDHLPYVWPTWQDPEHHKYLLLRRKE